MNHRYRPPPWLDTHGMARVVGCCRSGILFLLVGMVEDLLPQLLQDHCGLVHRVLLGAHIAEGTGHVLHEAIQVIIIHLQDCVDLLQGTTTIISRSTQCRYDVVSLVPLQRLQLGPLEEHVDPLVPLSALVQSVDHSHHSVETTQALEQLVHTILGVLLLCKLHADHAASGHIGADLGDNNRCIHHRFCFTAILFGCPLEEL
mmetsp:Transcript_6001/g.12943  ORF Transcript_6001/g.12943 Transcript_6001/m.12943 type:complete len:202 (+) Transcript_6001:130-735(+)